MSFPRPGPCPRCGAFVSVRTRHAGRCRRPTGPTTSLRWTGRSPLLGWPESHLIHRQGFSYCTSPVDGIGPRLLVILARHYASGPRLQTDGRWVRLGPQEALHHLMQQPPEVVLDQVIRPLPVWAHCGGELHSLVLFDAGLWPVDHAGIDLQSERVAAAIGGQRLDGCAHVMAAWQDRRTADLLPTYIDMLAHLDAAATWGVDELPGRDCWIDARLGAEDVAAAEAVGVPGAELIQWAAWNRELPSIVAWRTSGWLPGEASRLAQVGLSPAQSVEWRAAGLDVGLISGALARELDVHTASAWWHSGFSLEHASTLLELGMGLEEAVRLKKRYGSAGRVVSMARMRA